MELSTAAVRLGDLVVQRAGDVGGAPSGGGPWKMRVRVLVVPELHDDREDPVGSLALEVDELARGHLDDPVLRRLLALEDLLEGDLTLGVLLLHQVGPEVVALARGGGVGRPAGGTGRPAWHRRKRRWSPPLSARGSRTRRGSVLAGRGVSGYLARGCSLSRNGAQKSPREGARRRLPNTVGERIWKRRGHGRRIFPSTLRSIRKSCGIGEGWSESAPSPLRMTSHLRHGRCHCDIALMSLWCLS